MLKSLSIENYALIENLEIDFPEGFIIITGETGAGKSILMGAISLLFGGKADPSILKNRNKNCIVEATFQVDADREITLRRVINHNGKSRSFVDDEPVSASTLKELSEKLIDIHAQHQHLLLANSDFQLSVLDSYAENWQLLSEYQKDYELLNELTHNYNSLKSKIEKEESESDYIKFQLNQLKEARLSPGELEELEEEQRLLNNAESIKNSLFTISNLISPQGSETSVLQNLKEASTICSKLANDYKIAAALADRIETCRIELKDIEEEITNKAEEIRIDPERSLIVEERLSELYTLLKKHHADKVEKLVEIMKELEDKSLMTDNHRIDLEKMEREIEECKIKRSQLAEKLHSRRVKASKGFSEDMLSSIKELEMPHASFYAEISQLSQYNLYGNDSVTFFFSANKNIPPRELAKVASGGELSRIMLCLKAIMASGKGMPSMIFDEIDSGVSGSIADKMGNLLYDLSKKMQIFAITHLPQIASKGNCHLLVFKDFDDKGVTKTNIKKIEGEERVLEIARMLSGSELTQAAIANARELLKSDNLNMK
ncbi:MAG: DNA repair protein RecN [Bacteroidales bacterium]|jgi:DNA repair protein RecN (Recombination protein N)|nr:DNA repair protein RecN [Bacteroidales bacterium]